MGVVGVGGCGWLVGDVSVQEGGMSGVFQKLPGLLCKKWR